MRAGCADCDPAILGPCHGGAIGQRLLDERPGLAAVGGGRGSGPFGVGLAVIAADDNAVLAVAEGDREDAGGLNARSDRRLAHRPAPAAVAGMEDTRDL